jgi:hypothetical protein
MSFAASRIFAVIQSEGAAMSLRNLTAEDEADTGTAGLCGEEWNKQVRGVRQTGTAIPNPDVDMTC